jgi:hypothetical protein
VVEPPPSPILEEDPPQTEVDPRFRWPTPSPEPELEPEPEVDTKIVDAVKDSYPYQAEIHFKAIQQVVKENCPGNIAMIKAEIDPKMLGIIQKRICQIEVDSIHQTVSELVSYAKRKNFDPKQKLWLKENFHYLTREVLAKGVRRRRGSYVMSHDANMELYTGEKDCKGNDKPPQCTQCIDNHVPDEGCQHLFDGGPQNIKMLVEDSMLDGVLCGIYIGSKETIYIPTEHIHYLCPGYHKVRNLGMIDYSKINYPTGVAKVKPKTAEPKNRLRSVVMYRLTRIGKDSVEPCFIEFFKSCDAPDAHISHHIFGFMQELRFIQSHYRGPVVGVLVMPTPVHDIAWDDYLEHKKNCLGVVELANEISKFTGVAMVNLEIFDVPVEAQIDEQWYYRQLFWRRESLFGGKYLEVKTRVCLRRLGHELGEWIHDLHELDFAELHNVILKD